MKECGFGWNFGPYLSWPPFNRHHSQQWNHCKECAWLHTEDNLIVSCCENGDQAAVWVSRVERWVQPDLLPSAAWVAPHHLSALMFLSLEPKQMLCGEFAQDVVENWMNFVLCGPCHLVGEGWGVGGGLLTIVHCWEQLGGFMTTWVLFKSQTYEHALWIQRNILS